MMVVHYERGVSGYGDPSYEGVWNKFDGTVEQFKKWWDSEDHVISGPPDLGSCIYSVITLDGKPSSVDEVLSM